MRFMIVIKADKDSEAGKFPSREVFEAMGRLTEEMMKAGVFLGGEGLHPSSKGARVKFNGAERTVIDGPFSEAKELIGGYSLIEVKSMEEAIEWTRRMPGTDGEVEIRQVFELSDFPSDVFPPEEAARELEWREELEKKAGKS